MSKTTSPRRKLLICTIVRNSVRSLSTWSNLVRHLVEELWGEYDVTLSVYENDSTDGSKELLGRLWTDDLAHIPMWLYRTDIGTQQYGSVWSVDRLRNLAAARQACLDQVEDGLDQFDKICYIEPDVTYDPFWLRELVLARHPAAAGIGEPDVYSGWSLRSLNNPKESTFLYDVCATRAGCDDTCWDVNEGGGTWRAGSLVRTDLGGVNANCLHRVWSTFNCFCVYNAKPFKEGVRWGIVNKRIDPSGIWVEDGNYGPGWLDADTVNICEQFRERGYGGIYLNTNCLVRHN